MLRFTTILFSASLACACLGQLVDDKDAKILREQRFNAGDGRTGSAFATENQILFREESDVNGDRIGQYSYIGQDDKTYTVKYVAGRNGFRVLDGSHIPTGATGQNSAPATISEEEEEQQRNVAVAESFDAVDRNSNPFVNPHDPTHRNFQFNVNGANFGRKAAGVLRGSDVPNCADCSGGNPFDASHPQDIQPTLRFPTPPARPTTVARQPATAALQTTRTPRPAKFFPLGQLSLNRFETGFNFDFES